MKCDGCVSTRPEHCMYRCPPPPPSHLLFHQRLEELVDDPTVGAVVLRVDSPGGSAVASDSIAAAIRRVKAAGKPVVCSMGDVAASGGYMIAAACDSIVAQPTTITGSIGVIAAKLSVERCVRCMHVACNSMRSCCVLFLRCTSWVVPASLFLLVSSVMRTGGFLHPHASVGFLRQLATNPRDRDALDVLSYCKCACAALLVCPLAR